MSDIRGEPAKLTGRHVLIIVVSAFSVVIAVNLTLAFKALSTFPGLEVANSYVASQEFDARRDAQEALGWTVTADATSSQLRLRVVDAAGGPARINTLEALVGRATSVAQDTLPQFSYAGGGTFVAPVDLEPGYWTLRLQMVAEDGTLFQQRLELYVRS